jgi:uncharacterized protein
MKGLSPGAALVLLMAGPATNAATITMIGQVLGRRSLLAYLLTIISGALLSGLFIDYILPAGWFILSAHFGSTGHNNQEILPAWVNIGSAIILAFLILNGYFRKFRDRGKPEMDDSLMK